MCDIQTKFQAFFNIHEKPFFFQETLFSCTTTHVVFYWSTEQEWITMHGNVQLMSSDLPCKNTQGTANAGIHENTLSRNIFSIASSQA